MGSVLYDEDGSVDQKMIPAHGLSSDLYLTVFDCFPSSLVSTYTAGVSQTFAKSLFTVISCLYAKLAPRRGDDFLPSTMRSDPKPFLLRARLKMIRRPGRKPA